jgi:6,7-dimethyl-8-ribityllumazine synthase
MRQGIDETKIPRIEGAKIAILKSRWYPEVVESLADACRTALAKAGCSSVSEHYAARRIRAAIRRASSCP